MKTSFFFRFFLVLVLAAVAVSGCDDKKNTNNINNPNNQNNQNNVDPCAHVDCPEHASCDPATGDCVCDIGFTSELDACINQKWVPCDDISPPNAQTISGDVLIHWDTETGWSLPETCAWECEAGYVPSEDLTACLEEWTVPLPGFGTITGACGVLDTFELTGPDSVYFANVLDFADDVYDAGDFIHLTPGGQILAESANAGGSSGWSETFAFEVLARCELADLLKTETEIIYDIQGKITDILVSVDGYKIGVSVVRAMTYPRTEPPDPAAIRNTIERKLADILLSTQNVSEQDRWVKQVLSVMADTAAHETAVYDAWYQIDEAVRADTILYVTVTEGADDPIYTNQI